MKQFLWRFLARSFDFAAIVTLYVGGVVVEDTTLATLCGALGMTCIVFSTEIDTRHPKGDQE